MRYNGELMAAIWDEIGNTEISIGDLGRAKIQRFGHIGSPRHKPGKYTHGEAVGTNAHFTGHSLPSLSDEEIEEFNVLEDHRINGVAEDSIAKFNRAGGDPDTGILLDTMTVHYEVRSD